MNTEEVLAELIKLHEERTATLQAIITLPLELHILQLSNIKRYATECIEGTSPLQSIKELAEKILEELQ